VVDRARRLERCIRLPNPLLRRLFKAALAGTPVLIKP